ncbi:MAG: M23 family metallopeptidase [Bacillota bacterium]
MYFDLQAVASQDLSHLFNGKSQSAEFQAYSSVSGIYLILVIACPEGGKMVKDSWNDLEDVWYNEDYPHYKAGSSFLRPDYWKEFFRKRWFWQSGVALLLFIGMIAFFQMEGPAAEMVQANIRYALVAPESDLTPALEVMAKAGFWLDPFDNQALQREKVKTALKEEKLLAIPVSGKAARGFGHQPSPIDGTQVFHSGLDILAEPGAAVRATLGGKVSKVGQDPHLGRIIEIQHENSLTSLYGNLKEILVAEGQEVKQGELLGKAGGKAISHPNSIHFEIREKGIPIDPLLKMADVKTSI